MKPKLFLIACLILFCGLYAQPGTFRRSFVPVDDRPVVRGPRPWTDYSKVPDNLIQKGVIHLKLQKDLTSYLDTAVFRANNEGVKLFGIPELDRLNRLYHVKMIRQTFCHSLSEKQFDRRHRKWELQLWLNLYVPDGVDTKQMAAAYSGLSQVSHAEPAIIRKIPEVRYRYINPGEIKSSEKATLGFIPDDPLFGLQWHLNNTGQAGGTAGCDMHLPEAWDHCQGDKDVVVAVMDEGIDYQHEDLAANIWPGTGYNFVTYSDTIVPGNHGTHIGGSISGNSNNGIGIAGIAGGDGSGNGVKLMSCQVADQDGGIHEGVLDSYVWAADHGAAISNNSWGIGSDLFGLPLYEAIDYFTVNGGGSVLEGGIVICAAGNGGCNCIFYPACYDNCLGIAATNNRDRKSGFSDYGNWVDLSAPGGEYPPDSTEILSTFVGNTYGYMSGTSMASGQVSGVAALVISFAKGMMTADDLKGILLNSADNIDTLNPSYAGLLGSGRVNAYNAILLAMAYLKPNLVLPPASLHANAVNDSEIDLNWQENADNDSVLLAYNLTPTFGKPTGNYLPGQVIDSGGIVIYSGKNLSFSQTGLIPNTIYYYSLWSKKNNKYSFITRRVQDTTACGPIGILPYLQDFELSTSRPSCWSEDNLVYHWLYEYGGADNEPPAPYSGMLNAMYVNMNGTGTVSKLISEVFDLENYSHVQLSYWHAQAPRGIYQDEFRVYYRNSPASAWTLLKTYTQSIPVWTKDSIELPYLSSSYQLAFEGKGNAGNGVCLDHIELTDMAPPVLTVSPDHRNVPHTGGITNFFITSNRSWTTVTDTVWCIPTAGGFGNDTMQVQYLGNSTATTRTAHLTVSVDGLSPVMVTVTQPGAGGIGSIAEGEGISVWPNPLINETMLFVSGKDLRDPEVTLTGIDGRVVIQNSLKGIGEFHITLPAISQGSYFLIIKSDRQVYVKKLIKI